ncbi:MAG: hypothetical protein ACREKF_02900 [Candidatus Methylomirabilales bacterium]
MRTWARARGMAVSDRAGVAHP